MVEIALSPSAHQFQTIAKREARIANNERVRRQVYLTLGGTYSFIAG